VTEIKLLTEREKPPGRCINIYAAESEYRDLLRFTQEAGQIRLMVLSRGLKI